MLNRRNFLNRGAQTLPILGVGMAGGLALSGCAGVSLEGYKSEKPVFSLREYFNGPIRAWGIFTDRSGQVQKRFTVEMNCSWSGEQGTLDESFFYSDGTRQRRIWHLLDQGQGRFEGRADDVVGVALGESSGNAFRWTYTMDLKVGEQVWRVEFDDWMFLMDGQVLLNKSAMSKWGFHLGDVTLSFTRPTPLA
jgi:NOL1/NOP2/fmu family ribosome biogenesis protein